MGNWRFLACLILILYSVSSSECRLLDPNIDGKIPTGSFRMLSLATNSGKVYQFNIGIGDESGNENLYESKRRSPGGSESRPLTETRSRNQPIQALRQYLNEEAKKNQFEQVKRTSSVGPDQHHHFIYN
ncbi:hypothetical protein Gotur_018880 [Gossypium turneri]